MPSIRVHLDQAELDAVVRLADTLGVTPEALLYTALDRLMLAGGQAALRREIAETQAVRRDNLPLWADSACAVHAYEGKADDEPAPSRHPPPP